MSNPSYKMRNYMVPSNGTTNGVLVTATLSATPLLLDWRQYTIDNAYFQPQGVYIDNSAGTGTLTITINPVGWQVTVPAGGQLATSFPAPNGETMSVTGLGNATMIFVDYPVLPSATAVTLQGTANVNIANVTSTNPLFVIPTPLSQGLPYRDQEYVPQTEYHYGSITGSGTSVTITPTTTNQNLRKLLIYVSGDATNSGASEIAVTVTANGNPCFQRTIILPTAAPSPLITDSYLVCEEDFGFIGIPLAAGAVVVTISHVLTTGVMDVNTYFTPQ